MPRKMPTPSPKAGANRPTTSETRAPKIAREKMSRPSWSVPNVVATRLDLGIAMTAVALAFAIGALAGLAAGYYGGWIDRVVGRAVDTIMAFPLFVLAMGIVAALGNSVANNQWAAEGPVNAFGVSLASGS